MKKAWLGVLVVLAIVVSHGSARGALINRGGGLIYDTDKNITWLQDANYARTSGYDLDGKMNWYDATAWAAGLVYAGYDDWRLPKFNRDGFPYNGTGGELAHLYYDELGNWNYGGSNTGPFVNVERGGNDGSGGAPFTYMNGRYWADTLLPSGTILVGMHFLWTDADNQPWVHYVGEGCSGMTFGNDWQEHLAWPVRDGDVTPQGDNRPPVIAPVGSIQVVEFEPVSFVVSASDPDGDEVTLAATALPEGAQFDPATGEFSWVPFAGQIGDHVAAFVATDGGLPSFSATLQVVISVGVASPAQVVDAILDAIAEDPALDAADLNAYLANLKSVEGFVAAGQLGPARNQINAFIQKVEQDVAHGRISAEDGERYLVMAAEVIAKLTQY